MNTAKAIPDLTKLVDRIFYSRPKRLLFSLARRLPLSTRQTTEPPIPTTHVDHNTAYGG